MPALEDLVTNARPADRLFGDAERTLDDLVTRVLYDASRGDPARCPVCGLPALSASPAPERDDVLGCGSCGSRLEPA
jgi:hypothetical protein